MSQTEDVSPAVPRLSLAGLTELMRDMDLNDIAPHTYLTRELIGKAFTGTCTSLAYFCQL